jgi:monoamine oxidase
MSKFQDELQKRDGNIFFASADWAHGWRAFIDGALEQGFLNALEVLNELCAEDKATRPAEQNL